MSARQRFAELAGGSDAKLDESLALAALLIAAEENPTLDIDAELTRLDALAQDIAPRLADLDSPEDRLEVLIHYLHDELGFVGNLDAYYDPRNSFLDDVLSRRLGIPITLAVVYIEIGRRAGVPLAGAPFPGHFLVRLDSEPPRFFDPFAPEALLTAEECEQLWVSVRDEPAMAFDPSVLEPASVRQILVRMLRNLKLIYLQQNDMPRAIAAMDRILLLTPRALIERRDRGVAYLQLETYRLAAEDLAAYLAAAPRSDDVPAIQAALQHAQDQIERLN